MNSFEVAQHIQVLYETAFKELLEGFNCDVNYSEEPVHTELDAPVACIDAGSKELEITIGLELPMSVLAMSYPVPNIAAVDDEALEDWISEMSNQVVGRLKTKLMQHQQEITLGLPSTTFGVNLDDLIAPSPTRFTTYLDVDGEHCAFHIGIEFFTDDVCFISEPEVAEDALMESEIELF